MSPSELPQRASEAVSRRLAGRGGTRRSFLIRVAAAGSAAALGPVRFLLYPDSAFADCAAPGGCSSGNCTDGFSAFCCGFAGGSNQCPSGTVPGGWWWAAIPTSYCPTGKRYYMDCMGACPSNCSACKCRDNNCNNRRTCCNNGYTNCGGSGSALLTCRIVRCVNPCTLMTANPCSCMGVQRQITCSHEALSCSPPIDAPSSC